MFHFAGPNGVLHVFYQQKFIYKNLCTTVYHNFVIRLKMKIIFLVIFLASDPAQDSTIHDINPTDIEYTAAELAAMSEEQQTRLAQAANWRNYRT